MCQPSACLIDRQAAKRPGRVLPSEGEVDLSGIVHGPDLDAGLRRSRRDWRLAWSGTEHRPRRLPGRRRRAPRRASAGSDNRPHVERVARAVIQAAEGDRGGDSPTRTGEQQRQAPRLAVGDEPGGQEQAQAAAASRHSRNGRSDGTRCRRACRMAQPGVHRDERAAVAAIERHAGAGQSVTVRPKKAQCSTTFTASQRQLAPPTGMRELARSS